MTYPREERDEEGSVDELQEEEEEEESVPNVVVPLQIVLFDTVDAWNPFRNGECVRSSIVPPLSSASLLGSPSDTVSRRRLGWHPRCPDSTPDLL
jgi:hypothetical protein